MADEVEDFVILELRKGYPLLRVNHGTGEAKLQIDGRDRAGNLRMRGLNDGKWHKIDIFRNGAVSITLSKTNSSLIELKNDLLLELVLMCDVSVPSGGKNGGG